MAVIDSTVIKVISGIEKYIIEHWKDILQIYNTTNNVLMQLISEPHLTVAVIKQIHLDMNSIMADDNSKPISVNHLIQLMIECSPPHAEFIIESFSKYISYTSTKLKSKYDHVNIQSIIGVWVNTLQTNSFSDTSLQQLLLKYPYEISFKSIEYLILQKCHTFLIDNKFVLSDRSTDLYLTLNRILSKINLDDCIQRLPSIYQQFMLDNASQINTARENPIKHLTLYISNRDGSGFLGAVFDTKSNKKLFQIRTPNDKNKLFSEITAKDQSND